MNIEEIAPTPWSLEAHGTGPGNTSIEVVADNGKTVAVVAYWASQEDFASDLVPQSTKQRRAFGERIVACVNACAGIDDPAGFIKGLNDNVAKIATYNAELAKETLLLLEKETFLSEALKQAAVALRWKAELDTAKRELATLHSFFELSERDPV